MNNLYCDHGMVRHTCRICTPERKAKLLFVDDMGSRITHVLTHCPEFDITIATQVPEALRLMVGQDWDVISLDHDLNGHDFQNIWDDTSGMALVRYVVETGWPPHRKKPVFWIHSSNIFAAHKMVIDLTEAGFDAQYAPYGWKKYQHGVIAGAFDVIHPGYIRMLAEAKELCHKVTILLHDKPNQVFEVSDRVEILLSLKFVDNVIVYKTEEELTNLFDKINPDIRIVGNDHEGNTSRPDLPFPTHYHVRSGEWSATKYKAMIAENHNAHFN